MWQEKGKGKCSERCKKRKPCTILGEAITFDVKEHKITYCFTVYTDTDSTKPSHELELLKLVHKKEANLFACDGQVVYGDLEKDINGFTIQKSEITEKDFHFDKRKDMRPGTTPSLSNKSGRLQ